MAITLDDVRKSGFRGELFLDMDHSAFRNVYRSADYPRLVVVKVGSPRSPKLRQHVTTSFFVDGVECENLVEAVHRLNTEQAA